MRHVLALVCLLAFVPAGRAGAGTLGMVADARWGLVWIFDADTEEVLGSVTLGEGGGVIGDCSVATDQKLGFVTDFQGRVWVIDLSTLPPRLAAGTNPIPISNPGEDTSLSPDERFLVVCDGGLLAPVSVIDIAGRREIDTLDLGTSCNSVEVCSDGSVLVGSASDSYLRRLELGADGKLSNTGEKGLISVSNVACSPGAASGVGVNESISSFTLPGLAPADFVDGSAITAVISPEGDRIFLREVLGTTGGRLSVYSYDQRTGMIGNVPTQSLPIAPAERYYGIDQLAVHPSGDKLFVPNGSELRVYDTDTWAFRTMDIPMLDFPTGVCVGAIQRLQVAIDVGPGNPTNSLNPRSKGIIQVAILTSADLDAAEVDAGTVLFGPSGVGAVGTGKLRDVDRDGDLDLVLDFRLPAGISCGDTTVTLRGETLDGTDFEGTDAIRTVGCPGH